MVTRLTDSPVYAHLWSTPELEELLGENARWQAWLDVLVALARVQARHGLVPPGAAEQIAAGARAEALDLDRVAAGTRSTSHSTLGLIRELQRVLPESAREHVYVGATNVIAVEPRDGAGEASVRSALGSIPGLSDLTLEDRTVHLRVATGATALPGVLAALDERGLAVAAATVSRPSLDDVYLRHTGRSFAAAERTRS